MNERTINLLSDLVSVNTVNSENGDEVIELILRYLDANGGEYEYEIIDVNGIKNLVARTKVKGSSFVLNGHYDVVPADAAEWASDPFKAVEKNGMIYGRGSNDMKGGLAAQVSAFAEYSKNPSKPVLLMVVGDEEKGGVCCDKLVGLMIKRRQKMSCALIAEPSSVDRFGDYCKKGARGVLWLSVDVIGVSGHASRPKEAKNPIDAASLLMQHMYKFKFKNGRDMVPTTIVPTFVNSDGGATNIIPGTTRLKFDVRYNYKTKPTAVIKEIERYLKKIGYKCQVTVLEDSPYFINTDEHFEREVSKAVKSVTHKPLKFTTMGGSSDARFFSWQGIPALEFGTRKYNMHGKNECVPIDDVLKLEAVILNLLRGF